MPFQHVPKPRNSKARLDLLKAEKPISSALKLSFFVDGSISRDSNLEIEWKINDLIVTPKGGDVWKAKLNIPMLTSSSFSSSSDENEKFEKEIDNNNNMPPRLLLQRTWRI